MNFTRFFLVILNMLTSFYISSLSFKILDLVLHERNSFLIFIFILIFVHIYVYILIYLIVFYNNVEFCRMLIAYTNYKSSFLYRPGLAYQSTSTFSRKTIQRYLYGASDQKRP